MSDEIRVGRPDGQMGGGMPRMSANRNNTPWIVLAVVVLLIVIGAVLFRDKLFPSQDSEDTAMTDEAKLSGYQAVFLTNGQVYFGKLSDVSASYATLTDIYYLQVTQPPVQQASQGTGGQPATAAQAQAQAQAQLQLVKLGNELHGPVDEMKINRDQILFFEDIKEDGRVMAAIRDYQSKPQTETPATQAPATQTPATQAPATQQ